MRLPRIAATAVLVATAGCGACAPEKTAPAPDASASARPRLPPGLHAPSAHPAAHPQPKLACRVITVEGDVYVEQPAQPADAGLVPVLVEGLAPTEAWVDLAKGARFVAKDPRTSRETDFRAPDGPGRARACVGFAEESWIAAGHFESAVGAGEAPGAEEWVVTPFGAVRYAAGKLSVDVGPKDAQVKLESGSAFAWSPGPFKAVDAGGPALEDGWLRLPAGVTRVTAREPAGGLDGTKAALDRCQNLATRSRMLAVQVMRPDGGADGGTIAAQVVARRIARAACAVASMRVGALPDADAAPLRQPLSDANTIWSSLPTAP